MPVGKTLGVLWSLCIFHSENLTLVFFILQNNVKKRQDSDIFGLMGLREALVPLFFPKLILRELLEESFESKTPTFTCAL